MNSTGYDIHPLKPQGGRLMHSPLLPVGFHWESMPRRKRLRKPCAEKIQHFDWEVRANGSWNELSFTMVNNLTLRSQTSTRRRILRSPHQTTAQRLVPHSKSNSQHSALVHQRCCYRSPCLPVLPFHLSRLVILQLTSLRLRNGSLGSVGLSGLGRVCCSTHLCSTAITNCGEPSGIAATKSLFEKKLDHAHH